MRSSGANSLSPANILATGVCRVQEFNYPNEKRAARQLRLAFPKTDGDLIDELAFLVSARRHTIQEAVDILQDVENAMAKPGVVVPRSISDLKRNNSSNSNGNSNGNSNNNMRVLQEKRVSGGGAGERVVGAAGGVARQHRQQQHEEDRERYSSERGESFASCTPNTLPANGREIVRGPSISSDNFPVCTAPMSRPLVPTNNPHGKSILVQPDKRIGRRMMVTPSQPFSSSSLSSSRLSSAVPTTASTANTRNHNYNTYVKDNTTPTTTTANATNTTNSTNTTNTTNAANTTNTTNATDATTNTNSNSKHNNNAAEAVLFTTTMTGDRRVRDHCRQMETLLYLKRIRYTTVNVADNPLLQRRLREMYSTATGRHGMPPTPAFFVGEHFVGDYEMMQEMEDDGNLMETLYRLGYPAEWM